MRYSLLSRYFVAGFAAGLLYFMYCLHLPLIAASSRVPSENLIGKAPGSCASAPRIVISAACFSRYTTASI